ncbi:MAG: UbiA family prenyltransferase, partial [Anaerolineae bacterium]|nr:UbiA family prenyltransferase [Anaerolineae bacterium]
MSNLPGGGPAESALNLRDDSAPGLPLTDDGGSGDAVLAGIGRGRWAIAREYFRLTRPGIVAMVLVTMGVAALVSQPEGPAGLEWAHAIAGAALVIAGALALNQRLERLSDARMARTASRPLPAGRLTA